MFIGVRSYLYAVYVVVVSVAAMTKHIDYVQASIDEYRAKYPHEFYGYDVEKSMDRWLKNVDEYYGTLNSAEYDIELNKMQDDLLGMADKAASIMSKQSFIEDSLNKTHEWISEHKLFLFCYSVTWLAFLIGVVIWMFMGYL